MEEFSTFEKSIGVCFKMVMEGEYDWPRLSLEHWMTSLVWTWSFMLLLVLLMLNMILAIIMDIYTDARKSAGKSETVGQTFLNICKQLYYRKQWISNRELWSHVEGLPRLVTREELHKEFPQMCDTQLTMIIDACDEEAEYGGGLDALDTMKMTMAVKLCIEQIDDELQELGKELGTQEDSVTVTTPYQPAKQDRGWLQELSERMAIQNHRMISLQWQLQQVQWQWQTVEALASAERADAILSQPPVDLGLDEMEERVL